MLLAFGMQNTLVKFYSQCKTEQQSLFIFTVLFPIIKYSLDFRDIFIQVFLLLVEGEPDS
jgi:hypothetical protein